jgi:hypothetical protein
MFNVAQPARILTAQHRCAKTQALRLIHL